jgi:hypothetical protein
VYNINRKFRQVSQQRWREEKVEIKKKTKKTNKKNVLYAAVSAVLDSPASVTVTELTMFQSNPIKLH